ncbi:MULTISPECIES: tetratricopeptide repeat protein [Methylotenera]|uniref:tetratricopeptide repeat protein n=1 Tax=Methylotenera TaxID=359407 RepID=UPI0003778A12|nr:MULTISPECIES: tetratricopeptide repeat protein [Methylotenera]
MTVNASPSRLDQALAYHQNGHWSQALDLYQQVLADHPHQANVLNNVGIILQQIKRNDDALTYFELALAIEPDHPPSLFNRGNVLRSLNRPQDAVHSYDQVLQTMPNHPEVLNNKGNALRALNRLDDAQENYQLALTHAPDYADARWNAGLCFLLAGHYQPGWQEYEWRWASELHAEKHLFTQSLWDGTDSLQGKTILLHAEQGLGDTLQFCRYASLVKTLGATVVLEVQPQLVNLIRTLKGVDLLIARGHSLPKFDYHCPLLSLPKAFATKLDTIPHTSAYIAIDAKKVRAWRNKLGGTGLVNQSKSRVGLIWAGSATHSNDHNRSIALQELASIVDQNADFYGLQKKLREGDAEFFHQHPQIKYLGGHIKDFTDTAAIITLMDVVITVDTAVAHLAGAMGKPVWILLPYSPDWRWLLGRSDSPWYPTARLFRQTAIGDWSSVLQEVKQALQKA